MATKKITRKVIDVDYNSRKARIIKPLKDQAAPQVAVEEEEVKIEKSRKKCLFCQNKSSPTYTDLATLRRFLTDRAKIVSRERNGLCAKHQRAVARNIKYARHLSLLPFVPKV